MFRSVKRFFAFLFALFLLIVLGFFLPRLEWKSPSVAILAETPVGSKPFSIVVKDSGQGLKKVIVSVVDKRGEVLIVQRNYPRSTNEDSIKIDLSSKEYGMEDGPITLKVVAEDYSILRLFKGNRTIVTKELDVDLTPPAIIELSDPLYINHGGSGIIIYKTSDDVVSTGVYVGNYFFKGYSGLFRNPNVYISFLAYPYNLDLNNKEQLSVVAVDRAGNENRVPVEYTLRRKRYRRRVINVSENFIKEKIIPLLEKEKMKISDDIKKIFLKVNKELRKSNNEKIARITSDSFPKILWQGRFLQLSRSKVESSFADKRFYKINGEVVDVEYHLGYDLSVTKNYPVEVANDGIVKFAGELGIYGNSVIVDHGMGVMTLYSHLSSIMVKKGDKVKKGDIIGKTGTTGLAVGDHLHFGVYVQGTPVRPIEWWDENWIKNSITSKITKVKNNSNNN